MKLTVERIVTAGMDTFAEHGYEGLSMRQVAERLGVHAGSLYYHVRNKDALLALLADRIATEAYDAATTALAALPDDAGWQDRLEAQALALRHSIRARQGGPLLLAGSPATLSPGALGLMERLLSLLAEAGVPAGQRGVAADTLLSHVTGFVLQEQSETWLPPVSAERAVGLADRYPLTVATGAQQEPDEVFVRSVRLICAAIGTLIVGSPPSRP